MDDRTANLFAALVVALSDELEAGNTHVAGQSAVGTAALATLLSAPGARVDALGRVIGLTGSGTVRLVDRLVAAELVERRRDTTDQRAVSLWLTEQGRAAATDVVKRRREVVARVLAPLSDSQRAVVSEAVEPVLAHLVKDRSRADRVCRFCDYSVCPPADCPVERSVP
ncbi:MarR family winged helix-turn-helix transcriptional regulator [Amycolatopsis umgeniensis]|uniref:DNA-binding MarR family transcriptional regulator n=1 Tax=Amycolatopsis umgeniensis TaxID=336628 RepID=A0A841ATQ2_9PSEU|nr:MarR family transcriptional regulator [Amycolatopsis umgeniensis]MBB5851266.1 DNA-binding MarR family transcriptional regulator [Amycolatopsis umgeniensis]